MGRAGLWTAAVACAVAAGAELLLAARTQGTLASARFLSGWLALPPLLALAAPTWLGARAGAPQGPALVRAARASAGAGVALALCAALHAGLRPAGGWIELGLVVLALASLGGAAVGAGLARRGVERRLARWLTLQSAATHALLVLVAVHAALAHLHGVLARLVHAEGP